MEDSGIGIEAEQQAQIFEPFVIGENSDRYTRGIGLGLSITRHLVTLHRGVITVESQPTIGSTFHVYLPLPNLSGQLLMMPPAITQPQLSLVYISNRVELPSELKLLGQQSNLRLYQLRPAEVREHLAELQPSMLAWDSVTMTENDWSVMDYLRTTPQVARLPLMLYGKSATSTRESYQTGTTNILLKPFNRQTLHTLLDAFKPKQKSGDGILIVDDDVHSLDLYQQLIESALPGLPIHRAESGQQALSILNELVPDLVILDLVMPEVDGCDVVEWLRTNGATRNVPVIMVSGKVLTSEYIERLDFARVLFQTKDILNVKEATNLLEQTLAGSSILPKYSSTLIKRALVYIQHNYNHPLSIQNIVQTIGVSKSTLEKNFHQEFGISPKEYLNRYRIKEAKRLLETTNLSITEVANQTGFEDPAYFSRIFRAYTGHSPKEYRNDSAIKPTS